MIGVSVAHQEDFDVLQLKAERLDRNPNQRHSFFKAAVDQDVAFGCCDQIAGQPFGADVVHVSDDAMSGKWLIGFGRDHAGYGDPSAKEVDEQSMKHWLARAIC